MDAPLAQRSLLAKCLVKADRIKMGVPKLVRVLERLAQLDSETIQACLADDSQKWEALSIQSSNMEELKEQHLSSQQVADFYAAAT